MSVAVGIDIGAYKHAVAVCRAGQREADRRTIQIAADRTGFRQLAGWMETLAEPVSLVVMESSGHYWYNLASHLHRAGIPVAVVNPLESKYFGKRRRQRSKSDKADARTLAALGMHNHGCRCRWRRASCGRPLASRCAGCVSKPRFANGSSG